jgi:membrane protein
MKKSSHRKYKILSIFLNIWKILKSTFSQFITDNGLKLSASLSFYTIFSLAPLLIIIISLCGFFFGADAVKGEIFGQLKGLLGSDAAKQIQEIIKNTSLSNDNIPATIFGVIILTSSASGVFVEIQDSINFIWGLKAKPKRGFMRLMMNRLISFSMIGSVGFLLLVALVINTLMDLLNQRLSMYFPQFQLFLFYVINIFMVFSIITMLFTIVFKTLPDGKVSYKDAIIGSSFTAILFMVGKFAIGFYLGNSKISTTYGTAASIIIILIWVYYSAIILYFGAEFTKTVANDYGNSIIPNDYTVNINKTHEIGRKPILTKTKDAIVNEKGKTNKPEK